MNDSEFIIRARRKWVELYVTTKNATLVCRGSRYLRTDAAPRGGGATLPKEKPDFAHIANARITLPFAS